MDIVIKKASEEHLNALAEIERECFRAPWSRDALLGAMQNPCSLFWAAVLNGKTVGYIGAYIVADEASIYNIAVLPNYRRQGIAEKLLRQLQNHAKKTGVRKISLEVRQGNIPAINLYKKLNYHIEGKRPGYYQNPKDDACIMNCYLDGAPSE